MIAARQHTTFEETDGERFSRMYRGFAETVIEEARVLAEVLSSSGKSSVYRAQSALLPPPSL